MEPAKSIIKALGGPNVVAEMTGVSRSAVWRWTLPRERGGSDGLIPMAHAVEIRKKAADLEISISAEDFFPQELAEKVEAAAQ